MGSADSPTFNPMTNPELAAAMVAAYDDRYDRTGPLEDPVAPCLAAAVLVMAEQVVPQIPDDCTADVFNRQLRIRSELLALVDALEALPNG